ncbi:MAG: hypothetical protein IJZ58_05965 [Oscillospiraceae bacterium]|nr:hypothetical protein [Oscillospiraceae bacterium]
MPILSSVYYYYLFIIIEHGAFFNDVLQNYKISCKCSTWNKACEARPVDKTASKAWRCGQNIQGEMPQNILGIARMVFSALKWVNSKHPLKRSTWNILTKTQKAAFRRPFVFFQGNVSFGEAFASVLYN